jgi:hypothetical protein
MAAPLATLASSPVAAIGQRPLLAEAGPMTLRVRTRGCEERLVQIRSAKCTVGSAAGCTLRIHAAGMGPLACWILRGATGTIVRRLHGGATLNGGAFCESTLKPGDRLRIGSVELEIVECNPPLLRSAVALLPAAEPAPSPQFDELTAELAAMREQNVRLEGQARQGFQSSIMAAERADQLRDALAAAHEQLRDNSRELAETQETIARQNEQWENCQAELAAIRGQQAHDAAQVEEARRAAAETANERAGLENEVAQARSALANEKDRWDQERTQLERRLEQREAELVAVRSNATAQTSSMTVMIDEITRSKQTIAEDLENRCADLEAQLAQRQSEAAASHGEIESLRRIVGEQTIIEGRFEKLTRDYDVRCIELEEARSQVAAATAASSRAAEEAEERAEALKSWQEELTGREQRLTEAQAKLAHERETAAAEAGTIETHRQQIESQRQELASGRDALENERSRLAGEQAELAEQRAQLAADREQIAVSQASVQGTSDRESQLEQHTAEVEQQIAAANARLAELEQLCEQLTAERQANTERAQDLDQRQHELETRSQELEARSNLLESLRQDLDQQAAALAEQQAAVGREQAPLERQAAEERESVGAASSPLCTMPMSAISGGVACNVTGPWEPPAASPDDCEAQVASPASLLPSIEPPQHVDIEPLAIEPPSIEPPQPAANPSDSSSVDSVLSRLVKAGLWRDGEQPDAAAQVAAPGRPENDPASDIPLPSGTADLAGPSAPADSNHFSPASHRDSTGVSSEEESIESYMERLLKRVKGDSAVLPASMAPASQAPVALSPKTSPAAVEPATPEANLEQSEYSPRRAAPEMSTSLTAMRDLANSAARSAIDRHVRKNTGKQATGKLLGACLTVTTSAVLSYWAWRTHSFQAAVGAGIGGAAGVYWTFAAIRRLFGLMRLNRQQTKAAAAAAAREASSTSP